MASVAQAPAPVREARIEPVSAVIDAQDRPGPRADAAVPGAAEDWRALLASRVRDNPRAMFGVGWLAVSPLPKDRAAQASAPVLELTLDRAVAKGYLPAAERDAVRDRIERMAEDYGFAPDDFAMVALIESDGLNPRASNGNCHGIIQFCDGAGRGAASVGMAEQPRAILSMSVLEQLDLVDRYFKDTGLDRLGRPELVDLYLTVLTPAARAERDPFKPLNIAGTQARVLYEGGDRSAGITRRSVEQGLKAHAERLLGQAPGVVQALGARARAQAMAAQTGSSGA